MATCTYEKAHAYSADDGNAMSRKPKPPSSASSQPPNAAPKILSAIAVILIAILAAVLAFFRKANATALCNPPLASSIPAAVGEAFINQIFELAKRAERERPAVVQERNFGVNKSDEGGHKVTFLQHFALEQPALMDELWRLSRKSDVWGVTKRPRRLPLRCMELIEYASANNHSLGHHHDGDTYLTVSVLLSTPGRDFDGGVVELVRKADAVSGLADCTEEHRARIGDVLSWRGWEWHRVSPVTRGTRRVLVLEWWAPSHAKEEADDALGRGGDSVAGLRESLRSDPQSATLHKILADKIVSSATSGSDGGNVDPRALFTALEEAEVHYKRALASRSDHDGHALTRQRLGSLAHKRGQLDEAEDLLRSAHEAEPHNQDHALELAMFELGRKRGPDLAALRELLKVSLTTTTDEEESIHARSRRLAKLGNVVGVAAVRNQPSTIRGLAEVGVDVDTRDIRSGMTPLMAAASKGFVDAVEALLEAGADAKAEAKGGTTAIQQAEKGGHAEVARVLRAAVG